MKIIAPLLIATLLCLSATASAQEEIFLSPPDGSIEDQGVIDLLEDKKILAARRRRVSIDGQYEGTLYLKRVWGRGETDCNASDSFYYTFIVTTSGKYTSVYLQNGVTATGRRKRKSFRTIIDSGDYTYRVRGKTLSWLGLQFHLSSNPVDIWQHILQS